MQNFHWNMVYDELKLKSPVFLGVLIAATQTRTPRPNRVAVICVCASILLKYRILSKRYWQLFCTLVTILKRYVSNAQYK